MEETDVCLNPTLSPVPSQPLIIVSCPAKELAADQRRALAIHALAGTQTITQLAEDLQVSRKFVYQQAATASQALEQVFAPELDEDDAVLFELPVTKSWLRQVILGLVLCGHSSFRGVIEICRDLFDYPLSVGTVHNVVRQAVDQARLCNRGQDLRAVRIGGHDEIFQVGLPVLVGVDVCSTYCYLLSLEEHRDADTWGVRLLELQERGFAPEAVIADAGSGLRAGQAQALPQVPCRSDVFHALQESYTVVRLLEERAYDAMSACQKLEHEQARQDRQGRFDRKLSGKLQYARTVGAQAIALADDVALLVGWLRLDILSLAGPAYADRQAMYDFILAELKAREPACSQRLKPLIRYLKNQRDDLLAFAAQLDDELASVASHFQVAPHVVRELFSVRSLDPDWPQRYRREMPLRRQLGERYFPLSQAVDHILQHTVRASSVVENLNSRLRGYFFLRRHLGADYLALLQFFLNHRRFLRSEHPERMGRSPAEILTNQTHPHWLEMLGYHRFCRN
jgi:hypothetical protein